MTIKSNTLDLLHSFNSGLKSQLRPQFPCLVGAAGQCCVSSNHTIIECPSWKGPIRITEPNLGQGSPLQLGAPLSRFAWAARLLHLLKQGPMCCALFPVLYRAPEISIRDQTGERQISVSSSLSPSNCWMLLLKYRGLPPPTQTGGTLLEYALP